MNWNVAAGEFVPRGANLQDSNPVKESQESWEDVVQSNPSLTKSQSITSDAVVEAQTKSTLSPVEALVSGKISQLSLSESTIDDSDIDTSATQNGLLAEAEEDVYKETLSIVFIGHVDAGKSTTAGHILVLTGQVDPRLLERYEREAKEAGRESWYLSWTMDLNPEERAKGKTVECGTASFETATRRFNIVDAPGHKNFVPNMLLGAAQGDIGVLVISARRGEFETGFEKGGQTREHVILAKTAGLKKLVVSVNKMDEPTVGWSKERFDEIVSKVTPFLKLCGFPPKDILFIPTSGYTGANLKDRITKDVCPWYDGPSLLEYLDNVQGIERNHSGPLRIPIAERYKENGTVVAGKIESGSIEKGQSLLLMPSRIVTEAMAVYREEKEVRVGRCGESVRIRLKNVEENQIARGFVFCDQIRPVKSVRSFEAHVMILEVKNLITSGYNAILHVHHLREEVTLGDLLFDIDKKTGKPTTKRPVFLRKGDMAVVRIDANNAVCVEPFDVAPSLGRFTLRDETMTVASGRITKVIFADE